MTATTLRLFVAIELPPDVRAIIASTMQRLMSLAGSEGLRWVRPEGLHVTLRFLGAVAETDVPAISTALGEALRDEESFTLQLGGLGGIHGRKRDPYEFRFTREIYEHNLRVLFLELRSENDHLASVAQTLNLAVAPLGFQPERGYFLSHVTLARMREKVDREARERVVSALRPYLGPSVPSVVAVEEKELGLSSLRFPVRSVSLMQSTPKPGGPVYNVLATYPLVEAR